MANKSNNSNRFNGNGNANKGKKGFYQQPVSKQIFDKRIKDNAKVKY